MRETFQQDSFNQSTGPHQSNSDLNEISLIKSEDLNTRNKNEPSEIIKLNNFISSAIYVVTTLAKMGFFIIKFMFTTK